MTKKLNIFIFFFTTFASFAQSNFLEGTITRNDNSVEKGFIDYKQWGNNPKEISFKNALNASPKTVTLKDIKSFAITSINEFYKRAVVNINNEPVSELTMKEYASTREAHIQFTLTKDTMFLLTMLEGEINLYWMKDKRKEHFFVQKGNDSIQELIYRKYLIDKGGIKKSQEIFQYIIQIKNLTEDCANQKVDTKDYGYNSKQISNKILSYNNCKGGNKYAIKDKININSFFAFGGIIQPMTTYTSPDVTINNQLGSIGLNMGIAYELGYARNRNKMGMSFELTYQTFKSNFTRAYNTGLYTYVDNYNLNMQYVNFNTLIRYTLSASKIQPYLKGGVGFGLPIKANNTAVLTSTIFSKPYERETDNESLELNFILAFGLKINKFYLESRYSIGSDVNPILTQSLNTSRLHFTLGYYLK